MDETTKLIDKPEQPPTTYSRNVSEDHGAASMFAMGTMSLMGISAKADVLQQQYAGEVFFQKTQKRSKVRLGFHCGLVLFSGLRGFKPHYLNFNEKKFITACSNFFLKNENNHRHQRV